MFVEPVGSRTLLVFSPPCLQHAAFPFSEFDLSLKKVQCSGHQGLRASCLGDKGSQDYLRVESDPTPPNTPPKSSLQLYPGSAAPKRRISTECYTRGSRKFKVSRGLCPQAACTLASGQAHFLHTEEWSPPLLNEAVSSDTSMSLPLLMWAFFFPLSHLFLGQFNKL